MFNFEKFIKTLNDGFVLGFKYMDKEHKAMSFDEGRYVIFKFVKERNISRKQQSIVKKEILEEMFKDMKDIVYIYD